MEHIISNIPDIRFDQISHIKSLIQSENIIEIKKFDAPDNQSDDVYQFKDKTGERVFSVLIHPDKSIHLWRPL